jgi:hypothetical protein
VENIQQNASSGKKKDHKALEQQFSVLYQNIQLFLRSADEVTGTTTLIALNDRLLRLPLTHSGLRVGSSRFHAQRSPAASPARHRVH